MAGGEPFPAYSRAKKKARGSIHAAHLRIERIQVHVNDHTVGVHDAGGPLRGREPFLILPRTQGFRIYGLLQARVALALIPALVLVAVSILRKICLVWCCVGHVRERGAQPAKKTTKKLTRLGL
jgi:hypothetical protein